MEKHAFPSNAPMADPEDEVIAPQKPDPEPTHSRPLVPRIGNGERVCPTCGKRFRARKPWAMFCAPRCKDARRRENEEMGARFRAADPQFQQIQGRLGALVATVAGRQPLFAEAVAEIAGLHADFGELLRTILDPNMASQTSNTIAQTPRIIEPGGSTIGRDVGTYGAS